MRILIILILILSVNYLESLNLTDYCLNKETKRNHLECHGKHNLSCGDILCSNHEASCRGIRLFSGVKNMQRNEKNYLHYRKKFNLFLRQIKLCPEAPKYKWNTNDICLNSKDCFKAIYGVWSFQMKQTECKCTGKYSYKCTNNFCATNKKVCDEALKGNSISKIKNKCNNKLYNKIH
jgi:hypothetical protein